MNETARANLPFRRTSKSQILIISLILLLFGLATTEVRAQVFNDLHDFSAGTGFFGSGTTVVNSDGARPLGGLVISEGQLYGTTAYGGLLGYGVVFKLDFNGGNFSTIHAFDPNNYSDNYFPNAGLILDNGKLYGTGFGPTSNGHGFIFTMAADGSSYTPLFAGDGIYGYQSANGLTASGSVIYGTTTYQGSYYGSIFKFNTDQTGLTNFFLFPKATGAPEINEAGAHPRGTLVLVGDTLYGTAELGGSKGFGTVFSVKTDGTAFKVLHTFLGGSTDGALPTVNLALSGNTLYGTTKTGGTGGTVFAGGTVFKVNTDGSDYKVIHFFQSDTGGAGGSVGGVIVSGNTLYGMAESGGTVTNNSGALFSLNLDGTHFEILSYVPPNLNGGFYNGLIMAGNTLYGTSRLGGVGSIAGADGINNGFVFSITLPMESIPPTLSIAAEHPANSQSIILSWPTNATGLTFTLQSAADLAPSTAWARVVPAPVVVNGQNIVTNPISRTKQFFRLSALKKAAG